MYQRTKNYMRGGYSLSVIIPNYNNGRYLRKCIESVVTQSYRPNEIILIDDKSTDDSAEIIQQLCREYSLIVPVFLEENGGVSNARNTGIRIASGEYITALDADDFYYSADKLKNEMALIDKYRKNGKDILSFSITMTVDIDGNLQSRLANKHWKRQNVIEGDALPKMLSYMSSGLGNFARDYCIRKDILERAGAYSFHVNLYEDLDLLMRIADMGIPFYCTHEQGTAYRATHAGLSSQKHDVHLRVKQEIFETYFARLSKNELRKYHMLNLKNKMVCKASGLLRR